MAKEHSVYGLLNRYWGWMLALGIILLLLGAVGLYSAIALTLASVMVFGILLLIGGGVQVAQAFRATGWRGVLPHALIALLYIAAGILILIDPVSASISLTLFIAILLLATGVLRLLVGWELRPAPGAGWVLFGGATSILLGVLVLAQWPASGLFAIGLFVAIELIVDGWSCLFIALAARAEAREGRAE